MPSASFERDPIDLAQAEDMLRHVDAHDRETWVQVAKALAGEFGPAAEGVFLNWSASAENYSVKPALSTWRSALRKPGKYSAGTLVRFAIDGGYRFERTQPADRAAALERTRALREQARQRAVIAERQRVEDALAAEDRALRQWRAAAREGQSLYVDRKGIERPESCRYSADGALLVPMLRYDLPREQSLKGLQTIHPDGGKKYTARMDKMGTACRLGLAEAGAPVLVTEGWATGMSIRMAVDRRLVVYVAFDAGNLAAVVAQLPALHPRSPILICADDDWQTRDREGRPLNPGRVAAAVAAQALVDGGVRAAFVHPVFGRLVRREAKHTDYNDLQSLDGLDAVRVQIGRAVRLLEQDRHRG